MGINTHLIRRHRFRVVQLNVIIFDSQLAIGMYIHAVKRFGICMQDQQVR